MPSNMLPTVRYPYALDDYHSLMVVHNQSQTKLAAPLQPKSQSIELEVDFDIPQLFSPWGGYCQIQSSHGVEDIYYSRGKLLYDTSGEIKEIQSTYAPSGVPVNIGQAIVVDGLNQEDVESNTIILENSSYTVIGKLSVGGVLTDFAVSGNEGDAHFYFSRPDLFQQGLSEIDADNGVITFYPLGFGVQVLSMFYREAILDSRGSIVRRVKELSGLRRGLRDTGVLTHPRGAWIRSFIMAEHHAVIGDAALTMQEHIGIHYSEDRESIDFRLRDLAEICVEGEDWPCPEITFDFQRVEPDESDEECVVINVVDFNINIEGAFTTFGIFFGDGQGVTDELNPTHSYPPWARVEPSVFASNEDCRVASAVFEDQAQSVSSIPELPELVCPDILIPEIPPTPEIVLPAQEGTIVNIEVPEFPSITPIDFSQSIFISVPTNISVTASFPDISITIPEFTIPVIFPEFPDITVSFSVNVEYPPEAGPCFALVPCGGYCHGS